MTGDQDERRELMAHHRQQSRDLLAQTADVVVERRRNLLQHKDALESWVEQQPRRPKPKAAAREIERTMRMTRWTKYIDSRIARAITEHEGPQLELLAAQRKVAAAMERETEILRSQIADLRAQIIGLQAEVKRLRAEHGDEEPSKPPKPVPVEALIR
jgi:hypothetical protein